jgi:hypothetical protein
MLADQWRQDTLPPFPRRRQRAGLIPLHEPALGADATRRDKPACTGRHSRARGRHSNAECGGSPEAHRIFLVRAAKLWHKFLSHVLLCDSNRDSDIFDLTDRCLEQDVENQKHRTVP